MGQEHVVPRTTPREKLGLSLAGGGFRASLFHLGVLRRMAELDLLRRVEVLSTVSGGSIIGALYILLLKKHLEASPDGDLSRDEYVEIVDELEEALLAGIRKNLRTRLFMNPLGLLRIMVTPRTLGRRMSRLYERYLYADVVEEIGSPSASERRLRPGQLPLEELRIRPGGEPLPQGIERYNRKARKAGRSVSTRLVLNATSLNQGARFFFSSEEVGDWYLGYTRRDEADELIFRKKLLEMPARELESWRGPGPAEGESHSTPPAATAGLARWYREADGGAPPPGEYWTGLFDLEGFPGQLPNAEVGLLRQAKVPALSLLLGRRAEEDWFLFRDAVGRIDSHLEKLLHGSIQDDKELSDRFLRFVVEVYWFRGAETASPDVDRFWEEFSVGDAVAASANFPPLFAPFTVLGFYDDLHVSRLGLTDGGVFDNMGLTALLDEGCTQIIASDTSGLFSKQDQAATGRVNMMTRIVSVLQKVVAGNQREELRERRRVSRKMEPHAVDDREWRAFLAPRRLTGLGYFHIDSRPVELPETAISSPAPPEPHTEEQRRALAALRTDLDAFGELEVVGLVNHGYGTADRYIRRYFSSEETRKSLENEYWNIEPAPPMKRAADARVFQRALETGGARFFRALRMFAPTSWAFTLAGMSAVIVWTWDRPVSVSGVAGWIGSASLVAIEHLAPWLGGGWIFESVPAGKFVLASLAVVLVLSALTGRSARDFLRERGFRRWARRLARLNKWGRSLAGNVAWVLGLLPVALALVTSLLAAASDILFSRPYLRATRNRTSAVRKWLAETFGGRVSTKNSRER